MKRILIVDDIAENLYLLRTLLEGHGYQVDQAYNGSEAIVKALAVVPNLIITDILMPVIDGFTLCRIWKADERLARVPFVFYTATYTDPRDEKLALDMGADAFIVKPMEPEEFLRKMENVLALKKEGVLLPPQRPREREEVILKNYNEALVRKLEQKMLKLEQTNEELLAEMEARDRAEKALRETEERFRSLFENSMDGVLLTEPDGHILSANPAACRIFGRSEAELRRIGRKGVVDMTDPEVIKAIEERTRTGRFSGELTALRNDGSPFPCEISSAIFRDSEGNPKTSMVIRDITERKKSQEKLLSALREKDALMKEIHHRVKNNMQVMSSLINIQLQSSISKINHDEIDNVVRDLQSRIRSMALVHETLYRSKDLSRIDFREYTEHLMNSLFKAFNADHQKISFVIEADTPPVDITNAIPLGLIVNELVTNALKHAFPSGGEGEIRIAMSCDDGAKYSLKVCDNGKGLPDGFDLNGAATFGMRLIALLVDQLNGTIAYSSDKGAVFTVIFPGRRETLQDTWPDES